MNDALVEAMRSAYEFAEMVYRMQTENEESNIRG